ncbi:MAG: hypothetical protein M5U26_25880 [Planctomycetota bacterium]|nr:hypothetical protein [Planctomycetota bacterium]
MRPTIADLREALARCPDPERAKRLGIGLERYEKGYWAVIFKIALPVVLGGYLLTPLIAWTLNDWPTPTEWFELLLGLPLSVLVSTWILWFLMPYLMRHMLKEPPYLKAYRETDGLWAAGTLLALASILVSFISFQLHTHTQESMALGAVVLIAGAVVLAWSSVRRSLAIRNDSFWKSRSLINRSILAGGPPIVMVLMVGLGLAFLFLQLHHAQFEETLYRLVRLKL